LYIQNFFILLK